MKEERNKELEKLMENSAGHYGKMGGMDSDGDHDNSPKNEGKDEKEGMDDD